MGVVRGRMFDVPNRAMDTEPRIMIRRQVDVIKADGNPNADQNIPRLRSRQAPTSLTSAFIVVMGGPTTISIPLEMSLGLGLSPEALMQRVVIIVIQEITGTIYLTICFVFRCFMKDGINA
jgi:hypothetical protein